MQEITRNTYSLYKREPVIAPFGMSDFGTGTATMSRAVLKEESISANAMSPDVKL